MGKPAVLPGEAPGLGDAPGTTYYEIPIAIQDRSFDDDGSLFFPDTHAFFEQFSGPYIGDESNSDISPIWNPEFFGNTIIVNGNTWPTLDVAAAPLPVLISSTAATAASCCCGPPPTIRALRATTR